jgi:hypothetical protein
MPLDGEAKNEWSRDYRRRNPGLVDEIKRKWREANPEKRKAHIVVGNAVRDGRLVKGPCEYADSTCTPNGKIQAHHDDYTKPMEVRWLCPWHHKGVDQGELP